MELIVGVAAALSTLAWQPSNLTDAVQLGIWIVISGLFVALAVYDLRWMLLPNRLLKALLGVVIVFLLTQAFSGALLASWLVDPLIGASGALALFYGLHVLGRGAWMGGGDVKLVFILGLLLGWQLMALGLLLAFNLAAVISLLLIGLGWRSRQDLIPFGPFLLLGAWIALLWGEGIVDWYLRLSGL
ncbi:MAG: A24 family peptidase [Candidatus Saccharimonadales bacterium]